MSPLVLVEDVVMKIRFVCFREFDRLKSEAGSDLRAEDLLTPWRTS